MSCISLKLDYFACRDSDAINSAGLYVTSLSYEFGPRDSVCIPFEFHRNADFRLLILTACVCVLQCGRGKRQCWR